MNRTSRLVPTLCAALLGAAALTPAASAATVNIAVGQLDNASQSTTLANPNDFRAFKAVNGSFAGNTSGAQADITHTVSNDPNPFWRIDLGGTVRVGEITLYNRLGIEQRLSDITIEVLDADGGVVLSSPVLNPGNADGSPSTISFDPGDVYGRSVVVRRDPASTVGGQGILSLSEVTVASNNIATDSWNTASQSTTHPAGPAARGIDGSLTNFTHTAVNDPDPTWTLDLKGPRPIDAVILHNRDGFENRLSDITINLLDNSGAVVATSGVLNPGNVLGGPSIASGPASLSLDLRDLFGDSVRDARYVQVKRDPNSNIANDQGVLSIGEAIVAGPANIALGKPAFQSTTHPAGPASNATDGILTNFTHTDAPGSGTGYNQYDPSPTLTVDLQDLFSIEMIVLHNRDGIESRLRDIYVDLLGDDGSTVLWTSDLLNPGNALGSPEFIALDLIELEGHALNGAMVRVRKVVTAQSADGAVLSLGELQVFGVIAVPAPAALPAGLALMGALGLRRRR